MWIIYSLVVGYIGEKLIETLQEVKEENNGSPTASFLIYTVEVIMALLILAIFINR